VNQQAERRVGTIIGGKWRVDALLGSGSMAAVYAVTHRNGARAALKILHPTLCTDPAVCERFLGEGYLANSVKHTGIVRVLDDGVTDDGCVFLVMDLLDGETLEALRQRRDNRIPLVEALDIADKLMDVLSAVHQAGIIHRDLKPQNVFVCNDGEVKLLDFGVARVFDRGAASKLSMFGLVLGTPSFMSPEQALGSRDKVDHRSDIWSLGATVFTALTGETVHLGANVQAKLLAAATVKARSITMVMPDLPGGVAAAIDMSLRFKKEDRWQTVDAMRRAMREARAQAGLGKPQSVPPPGFDMSLDETTSVDKGTPRFDGSATIKTVEEGGTFIGMGKNNDGSAAPPRPPMKSIPPPLPMRARMPSQPPPMGTPGQPFKTALGIGAVQMPQGARTPAPAAIVRRIPGSVGIQPQPRPMPPPEPMRPRVGSRPDGQEGSIPAYGGTKIGVDDTGGDMDPIAARERKKSGGIGVWVAAVLLAAAALGGITFFAVRRGPVASPDPGSANPGPSTTTTTTSAVPTITAPAPLPMVPVTVPPTSTLLPLGNDPATVKDADAPRRPLTASGAGTRRRPPTASSSANGDPPALDPQKPPQLPPDPFGTPE
jgi:serine/threonine-protein kinase